MILKTLFDIDEFYNLPGVDTQYFGKDAENFLENIGWKNYIGKDCRTDNGDKGIIIGFEDSQSYSDYYYIVFLPENKQVYYQLANSSEFVKNIEI